LIKVNAESLKDFQICSLLYDYRHLQKIGEPKNIREKRLDKFNETIKRVCAFFFYKKQAYSEPSYQALLNRWQKLWFADETTALDIATMKNEVLWGSETSYTTQASAALLKFFEEFSNKPDQQVVLVDEKFCTPLNRSVALEGTFDVVLRQPRQGGGFEYLLYKWTSNSFKKAPNFWTFDFVINDYAFRYRNINKLKLTDNLQYFIWDFGSSNPGSKKIVIEDEDFAILEYWTDMLNKTELFVPRRGLTAYCKTCNFDKPCSKWEFPKKDN